VIFQEKNLKGFEVL